MRQVQLGCGNEYKNGWINIDKNMGIKADIYRNIEKGLPFDDDSVDEIYTRHLIEHIADDVFLFNEIWRVCKDGAKVIIDVPDADSRGAYDWDHKSFWNYRKFHYLNKDNRASYTGLNCNFKIVSYSVHKEGEKEIECDVISIVLEVVK